uniref:Uncharacterized protein n=1 Tax=Thermorudis peleae TaxID=1382356 RepID=A0A831WYQ1_9BACT
MAERQRGSRDARGSERGGASVALFRLPPPAAGGSPSRADQLILAAATGARRLSDEELREVLEHVAHAGFDPNARERARGELAGIVWKGQVLGGSMMLPPAERHYIKHVLLRREWPEGTTLEDYKESIRAVVLDPASGLATRRYEGRAWQLTVVRRNGALRGPADHEWILVDYRVETGHWMTSYQFSEDPQVERRRQATEVRWLRRPRK